MKCAICSGPTPLRCSECKSVFYCSREHQKKHWSTHKRECKPYEVKTSEKKGRYLVATRDIKAGEVVLRESALIVGPKAASPAICLGCHRFLGGKATPCSGCGWPLCSAECKSSPFHAAECQILRRCSDRLDPMTLAASTSPVVSAYTFLTSLRCLLLKKTSKKSWDSILNLQSHLEERLNTPAYAAYRRNVAQFIGGMLQMYSEGIDEETILRVCAILDTNTFEVRCNLKKGKELKARALLPNASLMNHDCCPNTRHSFELESADGGPWNKITMVVYTTVAVRKGEPLTATYTQSLWPSKRRRSHLLASKCFLCECQRCSDPTELKTDIAAMRCRKSGCGGLILPNEPLEDTSSWKCNICQEESSWKEVDSINQSLHDEILERASKANRGRYEISRKMSPEFLEEFLTKYQSTLHPKNHHILQVKHALTQIYGRVPGFTLKELSGDLLQRKVQLCYDLLEVANILAPGKTSFRADLIYDLYLTLKEKNRRQTVVNDSKKEDQKTLKQLADTKMMMEGILDVLKTEYDEEDLAFP